PPAARRPADLEARTLRRVIVPRVRLRLLVATFAAALVLPAGASAGPVFVLDGGGWGHGVGLSQWGAEGAARAGWSYKRILGHYYPHTRIEIVEPRPVRVLLAEGRK